ncbi:MAG: hypothetical protein HY930_05935 [Euryarchaeota archaeon]|nr:hypothetical protein [Euryarchaeota archaeon]
MAEQTSAVKIIEKIEEDAGKEADAVLKEARNRAEEIIKEARSRAKNEEEEILQKGGREAELVKQRIIADARLRARKRKLDVKEAAIQAAFSEAEKEIQKVGTTAKYPSILKRMIKEAAASIGSDNIEIVAREADRKILTRDFLKALSKEFGANILLAPQTIKTRGGAIVRIKDGKIEADNTFETRMSRMRDSLRSHIAKILFRGV